MQHSPLEIWQHQALAWGCAVVVAILSLHQPKDPVTATSVILTWKLEGRDVSVRLQLPSVTPLVIRHSPGLVPLEALLLSVVFPRQDRAAVARDCGQPWLEREWCAHVLN